MAAYVGKQDFVDRLGVDKVVQLSDRSGTREVDESRLNSAATAASATFDSYCLARYPAPITATPLVKKYVLDLAIYQLVADLLDEDDGKYKIYLDLYKAAIKFLSDVSAGKAQLDQAPREVEAAPSADVAFVVVADEPEYECRGVTEWQRL